MKSEHPIRTIRIEKRLTQFEFSKILEINQARLSSWEIGAIPIPEYMIRKISNIFKKNEDELKKESDNFYEAKREKIRKYLKN